MARVVINAKVIDQHFRTDPVAQAALLSVANRYKETASAATPRGRSAGQFRQLPGGQRVGPFGPPARHGFAKIAYHTRPFRGGFRVYTRDRFAHIIEYGSSRSPVYAPMRRALLATRGGRRVVNTSRTTGSHTL
jgi:hypothetical protein